MLLSSIAPPARRNAAVFGSASDERMRSPERMTWTVCVTDMRYLGDGLGEAEKGSRSGCPPGQGLEPIEPRPQDSYTKVILSPPCLYFEHSLIIMRQYFIENSPLHSSQADGPFAVRPCPGGLEAWLECHQTCPTRESSSPQGHAVTAGSEAILPWTRPGTE